MERYYIYIHIRNDNNDIFYVGLGKMGKTDNKYNYYKRANSSRERSKFWYNITNKTTYTIKIIFDYLNKNQVINKEKRLIKLIGRRDLNLGTLCNLTDGGEGAENVIISEQTRERLRIASSNRTMSTEARLKIAQAIKQRKIKFPGCDFNHVKRAVVQLDLDNNFINSFNTIKEAALSTECTKSGICNCCKNKIKTHRNFKWIYKEDYLKLIETN